MSALLMGLVPRPAASFPVPPVLNTVNPASAIQGQTLTLLLGGHWFVQGATVDFGPDVTVNSAIVSAPGRLNILSEHLLTVNITVAGDAEPGARDVTVTNPDQQTVTKNAAFTITAADPTPSLASFTLLPTTARGGAKLSGEVSLTALAPSPKGAKVTFTSNNPSVKAPKAVTIKKGQTMLRTPFVYKTKKVRSQTTATITATYGGISQPVTITLTP